MILRAVAALRPLLKRLLPPRLRDRLRDVVATLAYGVPPPGARAAEPGAASIYEQLYDTHARVFSDEDAVGPGEVFDLVGRLELAILLEQGLRPTDTLLDFGCGTGRLAVHVIPRLAGGRYIGVDVSQAMLDKAARRVSEAIPDPPCRVSWIKQTSSVFPFEEHSIDVVCAFSVFTHIEHEDTYRYLVDARRIVRPGGRFVFSCLPMSLAIAREIFLTSAQHDFQVRWSRVRNVTTSVEVMDAIARLAGWTPVRWYAGDERNIKLAETGERWALGQSTCVLEPGPAPAEADAEGEAGAATLDPGEVGRIVLTWDEPTLTLAPHLTGPQPPGGRDRFHLFPTRDGQPVGSLAQPPFATVTLEPERQLGLVSVGRLVAGTYRYAVALATASSDRATSLAQSGATVTVYHRLGPRPIVFRVPLGVGSRWIVFDVVVNAYGPSLRGIDELDGAPEGPAPEAWSPAIPRA